MIREVSINIKLSRELISIELIVELIIELVRARYASFDQVKPVSLIYTG